MSGAAVVTKLPTNRSKLEPTVVTPELAAKLLERNGLNRPLSDQHVQRIASQIKSGKWRFNGDTIKIADTEDILDGQHRLWAIIEAKKPVETIIVSGIARDAFSTIDTIRRSRSGGDVLSLNGASRHRNQIASAIAWLIRWQRGILRDYKAPKNRVENADIEEWFKSHPGMTQAVERAMKVRSIANPSILGFAYYVMASKNPDIADRMLNTFENPAAVAIDDPFFRLREYYLRDREIRKEPITSIALTIKAANAAAIGRELKVLNWRSQGDSPEAFPTLDI